MNIILASSSPRRRELLMQMGMIFEVISSDVEEIVKETLPGHIVQELALQKAMAVLKKQEGKKEVLVIGADTIVFCQNHILGKPKTKQEAVKMLQMLSGNVHEVYTGVSLLYCGKNGELEQKSFFEVTKVHFYSMTEEEIADYVEMENPLDKAGAYGIQGVGARYIKGIEGDYFNVVGLPIGRLYQEMKQWL